MTDQKIAVNCPGCSARMRVPSAAVGRRVRCPKCAEAFTVENPAEAEESDDSAPAGTHGDGLDGDALAALAGGESLESPAERAARMQALAAQAAGAEKRSRQKPAATFDEAPAPRAALDLAGWAGRFGLTLLPFSFLGRVCFAMILCGGALVAYGMKASNLNRHWRAVPTVVSCADLIARGSGGNSHIELTEFVMLPQYIYEEKLGLMSGAWAPLIPEGDIDLALAQLLNVKPEELSTVSEEQHLGALAKLRPSDFVLRAVVAFPDANGEAYMDKMYDKEKLECTLVGDFGIGGLGREEKRLLKDGYPRADLDKVRVLRYGGKPSSEGAVKASQYGGVILVAAGLVLAGMASRNAG